MGPATHQRDHYRDHELRGQRNGHSAHARHGQRAGGAVAFYSGLGESGRVLLAAGFCHLHGFHATRSTRS